MMKKKLGLILFLTVALGCFGVLAGCGAQAYAIVVEGGTASAESAPAGTTITLQVDTTKVPLGKAFHHWEVNGKAIEGETFTMGEGDATVVAVYDGTYKLAVTGGFAKSEAAYREQVKLTVDRTAIPAGKEFSHWVASDTSVTVNGNYLTMPGKDLTVSAAYRDIAQGSYKITYITNIERDYVYRKEFVEPNALPERPEDLEMEGHSLIGWFRDEAYTQPFDFDNPVNSDLTVYAKWTVTVYEDETGIYLYGLKDGKATITGLTEKGKASVTLTDEEREAESVPEKRLSVPNRAGGYEVTEIGAYAFANLSDLTAVALPEGVTRIGDNAFYWCTGLKEVAFPASLREIGQAAFIRCVSLENASLPEGLALIEKHAFSQCAALTSVTIPNTVKELPMFAFEQCTALETVVFGSGLERIGSFAFIGSGLKAVTVPENVKEINDGAFQNCLALESAVIEGAATLGGNAFASCAALKSVQLPQTLKSIGAFAFAGCGITALDVPENVAEIGMMALATCKDLQSVRFYGNTPPVFGISALPATLTEVLVPEGSEEAYRAALPEYAAVISAVGGETL